MSHVEQASNLDSALVGLEKFSLSSLQPTSSLLNKYVTGAIHWRGPLVTSGKHPTLKLVLKEAADLLINVYFVGDFAVQLDKFKTGETVYLSNALIQRSHTFAKDNHHICQLIVDKNRGHPLVLVCESDSNDETPTAAAPTVATNSTTAKPASVATTSASTAPPQTTIATAAKPAATAAATRTSARTETAPTTSAPSAAASGSGFGAEVVAPDSPARTNHGRVVQVTARSSPLKAIRTYRYTPLQEIRETSSVDVYGVVKFLKPPFKTRGPDYCMVLTIIDPSLDDDDQALKCVFFDNDTHKLPQVKSIGDIVRLHRLKVQKYLGDYQGTKKPGFSWLVIDGKCGTPIDPRSSSAEYTFTDDDKKKVEELREWAAQQTAVPLQGKSCTLSEIVSREYFDLTCQVVAMAAIPSESCVLVKVWDGTKYKWPVRCLDVSNVQVKWDVELAHRSEGLMVDVALYDNHMKAGEELKPGQFIRLYNLHAAPFTQPGAAGGQSTADHTTSASANNAPANNASGNSATTAGDQSSGPAMIELALHHGTAYGRGLVVLEEREESVRELKGRMEQMTRNQRPLTRRDKPLTIDSDHDELDASLLAMIDGDVPASAQQRAPEEASVPNSLDSNQEPRCMQTSGSVIVDHHDLPLSTLQQLPQRPFVFREKVRVVDYFPRSVEDFVHLSCPKCRLRFRVPRIRTPALGVQTRGKRRAEESVKSQPSPSKRTKPSRKKTHKVRVEVVPDEEEEGESAVHAYISDLTVNESLSLMKEGLQLVRVPRMAIRTVAEERGRNERSNRLYVCPRCCPDQHEESDVVLLQYQYWVKLWLQDSTGRVEATVHGDQAELFFGVLPGNLAHDEADQSSLLDVVEQLCPKPGIASDHEDVRTHPKIECCLEQGVVNHSVTYSIVDTKLALNV